MRWSAPKRRTLLVDANLLLLLLIGLTDRTQVEKHGRTKGYTDADFQLLFGKVSQYQQLVVTPHILTETSNIAGQCYGALRKALFDSLARQLSVVRELMPTGLQVVARPIFLRLGLTDAAISHVARDVDAIITDDLELYVHLSKDNPEYPEIINFSHLRMSDL